MAIALAQSGEPAGAGIGGGKGASGGNITIAGGVVTASSYYGAGIGSGKGESENAGTLNGGTIRITGGMVTASSSSGAGIGGVAYGNGGDIMITGGVVMASSNVGIGGNGGTVTITGGVVTASGGFGIGIGGNDGTVTITSGMVTARGDYGAGIGDNVTITGGVVTAIGIYGAGIGNGTGGSGGTVTITGGVVMANGESGAGIGNSQNGSGCTFTTTKDGVTGNALIIASSISDTNNKASWSGLIFGGDGEESNKIVGKIYGMSSFTMPEGVIAIPDYPYYHLKVENSQTLTIGQNSTLIIGNNGAITNSGTITNNGVIGVSGVSGTFTNNGTYSGNSGTIYKLGTNASVTDGLSTQDGFLITFNVNGSVVVGNMPSPLLVASNANAIQPEEIPTRVGYTFDKWLIGYGSTTEVGWGSTISSNITAYAKWKYNPEISFNSSSYSCTYGETAPSVGGSYKTWSGQSEYSSSISTNSFYTSSFYTDDKCQTPTSASDGSGATSDGGAPKNAGTYYVKASYDGDNNNMQSTAITAYTIKPKELTVSVSGAVDKVYDGETTVSSLPTFTLSGAVSDDKNNVNLKTEGYVLTYASKDVGTGITLTAGETPLSLTGDAANNYSLTQPIGLTGNITAKELIVIPAANQFIYSDEYPAYTIDESHKPVGNEVAAFKNHLGVSDNGKVTKGDLTLDDDETNGFKATNYSWKLSADDIAIEQSTLSLEQAYTEQATTLASGIDNTWKKQDITLTPAEHFKIKPIPDARQADNGWQTSITLKEEGSYDFTYELQREGRKTTSGQKTIHIQLDKTAPSITLSDASGKQVTVALSDATSGIASCTYSWDSGNETDASPTSSATSHSFTLTGDAAKMHLKVTATDAAGNTTTQEKDFDFSDPVVPPVDPPVNPPVEPDEPDEPDEPVIPDEPVVPDEPVEPDTPDDPVANEPVKYAACRIYASGSTLCIDTPFALDAWIVTADGRLLHWQPLAPGANRVYGLPKGIYIIRLSNGTTQKVRVGNG